MKKSRVLINSQKHSFDAETRQRQAEFIDICSTDSQHIGSYHFSEDAVSMMTPSRLSINITLCIIAHTPAHTSSQGVVRKGGRFGGIVAVQAAA
ncbi:hypothetical protein E4U43_000778 [Claviceps pusilla]|uniref:Uncharacterized protein n=1 Tax=Claviceps pusilla TaxID=123648 RepID=A0A9P7SWH2_9HYPO|nr:hypothetical protein E4U43_000778 [Claviceps pusilla]